MTRERITTEIGIEIKCRKCEQFWPADAEFFYFGNGRPHSWCKDCYNQDPKVIAKRARWSMRAAEKKEALRSATA